MADLSRNAALQRNVRYNVSNQMVVAIQSAFRAAARELGKELSPVMADLGKSLEMRRIPNELLKATNLEIAREAQLAMLRSFRSRLPRNSSPYRPGPRRRRTGTLVRALANSAMTSGTTATQISFVNSAFLTDEASHWYRVNYGAVGPNLADGRQQGSYTLAINSRAVATLRDDSPPATHTWLPVSFVMVGGEFPAGRLYPTRAAKGMGVVPGVNGSRAARFTDAGLQQIAKDFGPAYFQMFTDYARTKRGATRLKNININVKRDIRVKVPNFKVT